MGGRERKSQVAHKRKDWLHNFCGLEGFQCFKAGEKIRSAPQVGR